MRARLDNMSPGQRFVFLCLPIMAERMESVVAQAGGIIEGTELRSYGLVMTIGKGSLPASPTRAPFNAEQR